MGRVDRNKYLIIKGVNANESRPVWGAWIEIELAIPAVTATAASRPVWGAWIEMVPST